MKQTIGNKIKRFVLALFAALCVGNMWAATFAGDAQSLSFNAETKTVSFGWNCKLYDTDYRNQSFQRSDSCIFWRCQWCEIGCIGGKRSGSGSPDDDGIISG